MKYVGGNIKLDPIKLHFNTLRYDNTDYLLTNLSNDFNGKSKGGNSNVFKLSDPNTDESFVIKLSKFDLIKVSAWSEKRILRFQREIEALEVSKANGLNKIIDLKFNDSITIGNKVFSYYVMETADYDLTDYLYSNDLSIQQSFALCLEILEGIQQLHSLDIYHRDIKPDNILHTPGGWKIGDLGLVDYRDSDIEIMEEGEKIGPIGWLSPEASNKFLCEGKNKRNPNNHNCELNYNSDVFQLGKLFWYIFQGNIPIGQIDEDDFVIKDKGLFNLLYKMLSHNKYKRYDLTTLKVEFSTKSEEYAV